MTDTSKVYWCYFTDYILISHKTTWCQDKVLEENSHTLSSLASTPVHDSILKVYNQSLLSVGVRQNRAKALWQSKKYR